MKNMVILVLVLLFTNNLKAQLVTTVAGQLEIPGSNDGEVFQATFNNPHGIAVGQDGTVYTADRWSHTIRKITIDGQVTTLAGNPGISGSTDGVGSGALFNEPWGLCVDNDGNVFVADTRNNKIRKVTPSGEVTTIAGSGNFGTSDGFGTSNTFGNPTGIEIDSTGNIYVADHLTHIIRKIDLTGYVSTIAGKPYQMGSTDGQGNSASFARPYGLTIEPDGNILVADEWNHKIRRITPEGQVTTVAGDGTIGGDNGLALVASFNYPWDMTVDSFGNIFVADGYNYVIRKITPSGHVSSYVGTLEVSGGIDAVGDQASFSGATAIALSPVTNEIYVGDAYNHLVRKITDLNPDVPLSIVSNTSTVCQGEPVEIVAYPNIFDTYHFYMDNNLVQTGPNSTYEATIQQAGNHLFEVVVVDNSTTYTSDPMTITVIAADIPTITNVGATTFFEGDSVILVSSFGEDYFWSTGETTPTITVHSPGVYTVEVTDNNGCVGMSEPITVTVQEIPDDVEIGIQGSSDLCVGETALLFSNYNEGNQWFKDGWPISGATGQTYQVGEAGIYQSQVTHSSGVVDISNSIEITVLPEFNVDFSAEVMSILTGEVVNFMIDGSGVIEVEWDFGDPDSGIDNTSTSFSPNHQYDQTGEYTITLMAENQDGCRDTLSKTNYILVSDDPGNGGNNTGGNNTGGGTGTGTGILDPNLIFIPTAFTPNSDGQNDILFVRGEVAGDFNLRIFNHWGEVVFESFSQSIGWDGTSKDQLVQNGNYVYLFTYSDDEGVRREIAGHVTVLK